MLQLGVNASVENGVGVGVSQGSSANDRGSRGSSGSGTYRYQFGVKISSSLQLGNPRKTQQRMRHLESLGVKMAELNDF